MKKIFNIVLLTFIVIVIWIVFSIYSSYTSNSSLLNVPQNLLQNFNTSLYIPTLKEAISRSQYICVNSNFTAKSCSKKTVNN